MTNGYEGQFSIAGDYGDPDADEVTMVYVHIDGEVCGIDLAAMCPVAAEALVAAVRDRPSHELVQAVLESENEVDALRSVVRRYLDRWHATRVLPEPSWARDDLPVERWEPMTSAEAAAIARAEGAS